MQQYLASSEYIDWQTESVLNQANKLAKGLTSDAEIAKRCFEFVRDDIQHSWDYQRNPVTCKASQVLEHKTGYCYAKSHLLAALLRANNIPAGLCYQRLTITDQPPFCLHGLNAIYLKEYGWYRVDPRGNKQGVDAQFTPPKEQLAFPILMDEEADLPEIWSEPLPLVIQVLTTQKNYLDVVNNLPDILLLGRG